jgi:hypothetical protein
MLLRVLSRKWERMPDAHRLDVLRFVDLPVERKSAWGPGEYASRQLEVNGQLLGDLISSRTGSVIEQSTPIVVGHVGVIAPAAYLRALLGGPKDDVLADGRVPIGYCDACLDGTCGVLLAATLSVEGDIVGWSDIGFESYDDGVAPRLTPFWRKADPNAAPASEAHWEPSPFVPEISRRFARDQYLEALQGERRRLADQQ